MPERPLDDLQSEDMLTISKCYGGKVKLKDKRITTAELQEMIDYLKGEIASRKSQTKLRLIKC